MGKFVIWMINVIAVVSVAGCSSTPKAPVFFDERVSDSGDAKIFTNTMSDVNETFLNKAFWYIDDKYIPNKRSNESWTDSPSFLVSSGQHKFRVGTSLDAKETYSLRIDTDKNTPTFLWIENRQTSRLFKFTWDLYQLTSNGWNSVIEQKNCHTTVSISGKRDCVDAGVVNDQKPIGGSVYVRYMPSKLDPYFLDPSLGLIFNGNKTYKIDELEGSIKVDVPKGRNQIQAGWCTSLFGCQSPNTVHVLDVIDGKNYYLITNGTIILEVTENSFNQSITAGL